jgi:Lrp/AsnC family transcriptional regulator for asnA, asnC and gidA
MEKQLEYEIDNLDKKILSLIQADARISFTEIARKFNMTGQGIHLRIQKLINIGVIKGSHYDIDPKMIGYHTCAYIGIFLEKGGQYEQVLKELEKIPEIIHCDFTTGNYSIFVKMYTRDNEHLKKILSDQLLKIKGISRTETIISLEDNINRFLPII